MPPVILVSGKNGQLGKELQDISSSVENFEFIFFDKEEMNIADEAALQSIFKKYSPSFFINCAAYTAVDKAETEKEAAYKINAASVGTVAKFCNQFNTKLIHVSTDYVFDGKGTEPYKEENATSPVNYYGYTKLEGEQLALKNNPGSIIIRTSWVYSKHGNNFVKTMLRLMHERKEINVVNDQFGSPTYAKDLAEMIVTIVNRQSSNVNAQTSTGNLFHVSPFTSHVYHFSNEGIISWYDFAVAIKEIKGLDCKINSIPTSSYPTPAKRPSYSAFNKTKIINAYSIQLKNWKESLSECLSQL